MPGQQLHSEGLVLSRRPPTDRFQQLAVLTPEQGVLTCLRRLTTRPAGPAVALDLFDEADFFFESSNQGRTWFIREVRLLGRHADIGQSYDTLRLACGFAATLARNPGSEEGRARVYDLARRTFAAFNGARRSDLVYLKGLYSFARDEGYPVKQDWWQNLPPPERGPAADMLSRPVSEQTAGADAVARLTRRLEDYLRAYTEILLE